MTKNTKNRNIDLYSNSQICLWPKAWSLKLTCRTNEELTIPTSDRKYRKTEKGQMFK